MIIIIIINADEQLLLAASQYTPGQCGGSINRFDTDPDPCKKRIFSTMQILKIWKKTLISHALCVYII